MIITTQSSLSSRLIILKLAVLLLIGHASIPARASGVDDVAAVRERITSHWHGLDSLECRSVEKIENQGEERDGVTTIDFSWKSEGRSALSFTRVSNARASYFDERDDGARLITSRFYATPPKAIDQLLIRPSQNRDKSYGGQVYPSFCMLLPGGRRLADILEDGGTLANEGTARSPRWTLKHRTKNQEIECILDENYQYLPREMTITYVSDQLAKTNSRRRTIKVRRFDKVNGFCFPAEGASTLVTTDQAKNRVRVDLTFQIEWVAFNQAIDPAKFTLDTYPPGVEVVNLIDNTSTYIGGKLAHTKSSIEHQTPKQEVPTNPPIKVSRDVPEQTRWWVQVLLWSIALLSGGLGIYFRWRGL